MKKQIQPVSTPTGTDRQTQPPAQDSNDYEPTLEPNDRAINARKSRQTEGTEPLSQPPEGWNPNRRAINAIKRKQDETYKTEPIITATQDAIRSARSKQIVRKAIQDGQISPIGITIVK